MYVVLIAIHDVGRLRRKELTSWLDLALTGWWGPLIQPTTITPAFEHYLLVTLPLSCCCQLLKLTHISTTCRAQFNH